MAKKPVSAPTPVVDDPIVDDPEPEVDDPVVEDAADDDTDLDAEPSTESPAEVAQQPVVPPASFSLKERLKKSFGFEVEDDESGFGAIETAIRTAQAQQQFVDVGRRLMPKLSAFEQWEKDQAQAIAKANEVPEVDEWKLPEYDENWEKFVDWQDGVPVVREQFRAIVDPSLPQKMLNFRQAQQDRLHTMIRDFPKLVEERASKVVEKRFDELFQTRFGQIQQQSFVGNVLEQNKDWMFEKTADGSLDYSRISPQGMDYATAVTEAQQSFGISDPQKQHAFAMRVLKSNEQPAAQAAAAPVDPQAQRNADLLAKQRERATRKPGRSGSVPETHREAPSQNNRISYSERFRRQMAEDGLTDADLEKI